MTSLDATTDFFNGLSRPDRLLKKSFFCVIASNISDEAISNSLINIEARLLPPILAFARKHGGRKDSHSTFQQTADTIYF